MVKVDRINLSNEGLTKFFSPTEAQIMGVLWAHDELTTSEITTKTDISLSSVAGTLDRLVKAGFAQRHIDKNAHPVRYVYSASDSIEETANSITRRVLDSLVDTFGKVAVDNFHNYQKKE
ncbi:putative transcriptional regulator [Methanohalophilus levihalophilus]|uniref:BlaI/MecI/CopY family transcriptional regulator n=1 Tax=Methanohalophilus levihalophilus TaxID=1431282 RepID=UPI001AE5CB72|nr:BlaI/MecI/CopY family transcriptional regulator [Methanohalophilus levihalophilus]MBP2031273.1 putative transcriptional regulator [Methanohalophilus levihalophilus]